LLRRLDRRCQNRNQFVGLAYQDVDLGIHDKLCILDEPQPVESLPHLLVRHTDLVNEVCATLGTARFLVVRSAASRRPHQLSEDVLRSRPLRKPLAQPNDLRGEPTQPDGDVLALHIPHATGRV
jgi:hypothetical protein